MAAFLDCRRAELDHPNHVQPDQHCCVARRVSHALRAYVGAGAENFRANAKSLRAEPRRAVRSFPTGRRWNQDVNQRRHRSGACRQDRPFSRSSRACRSGHPHAGCDSSGFDAFLGEDALLNSGTGSTAVGYHALQNNSGNFNVGVGQNTLLASSGGENVATGSSALGNNTTGYNNTAIGGSNGKGGGSVLIPLQCFPGHRSLGEGGNDPTT